MNASTLPKVPHDTRSRRVFVTVVVLAFAASIALTLTVSASMPAMSGLPMPGGWMLSSIWTGGCGKTWLRAAMSFVGMWIAMMTTMMLPSFAPMLRGQRIARGASLSAGYALAWTAFGAMVFVIGAALAAWLMRSNALARLVPLSCALAVIVAGALQCSGWKARRLACCRPRPMHRGGIVDGLRYGAHCVTCCAPLTIALFATGVMNPLTMLSLTAAISAERLASDGRQIATAIGIVLLAIGLSNMPAL